MNKPPFRSYSTLSRSHRWIYRSDQGRRFQGEHRVLIRCVHDGFGPLGNYTSFPSYLSVHLVLLPFLIVYLSLFMVLIPRYPKPRCAKASSLHEKPDACGF